MKIKFAYHNANPFNSYCGDCAIRAISKCENISWERAHANLFNVGQKIKNTPTDKQTILTYLGDRYHVWKCNTKLKDFQPSPNKRTLLLLSNKSGYHLIFTDGTHYYDVSNIEKFKYTVIEIYELKEGRDA